MSHIYFFYATNISCTSNIWFDVSVIIFYATNILCKSNKCFDVSVIIFYATNILCKSNKQFSVSAIICCAASIWGWGQLAFTTEKLTVHNFGQFRGCSHIKYFFILHCQISLILSFDLLSITLVSFGVVHISNTFFLTCIVRYPSFYPLTYCP